MFPTPNGFAKVILDDVRKCIDGPEPDDVKLTKLWFIMCGHRGAVLATLLVNTVGLTVQSGPFKGMKLTQALVTGVSAPAPHVLGTYELELQPAVEAACAQPYDQIINIGCNFGYYAVGLALRMPQAQIHACDIDTNLVAECRKMAELNGVGDRLTTGGLFKGEDFASYPGRVLVFMDIEGAEIDLLDPATYPALRHMDIIVELHTMIDPKLASTITRRFQDTHTFEGIYNKPSLFDFAPMLGADRYIDPVDALVANWEGRAGPTPWGIFQVKNV